MSPQLKANLREFGWIANVIYSNQLLATWHTSQTKTLERCQAARHHHRHHRRGLGLGAVSAVLQQRARHQLQDHLRLSQRRRDRSRDGARRGRGPRHQSVFVLHGVASDLDSAEQAHPAGAGRRGEGAGAAECAADPRSAGAGRRTSRCWSSWRAARRSAGRWRRRRACPPSGVAALRAAFEAVVQRPGIHRGGGEGEARRAAAERATRSRRSSSGCSTRRRTCASG